MTFFVGYAQHIRDELSEIKILQNLQMARLCHIEGKINVHIIIIIIIIIIVY